MAFMEYPSCMSGRSLERASAPVYIRKNFIKDYKSESGAA